MKIKNFAMLAGVAGLLAACGGSTIVEPADLNDQRVYFAFDSYEISDEARDNLLGQSLYMKNHADTKIQIAGNCDERGSSEYNLALGARRANAAKAVLVDDGIERSRVLAKKFGNGIVMPQQQLNNCCSKYAKNTGNCRCFFVIFAPTIHFIKIAGFCRPFYTFFTRYD